MECTYADLQQHHNEALRNSPLYVMECMRDLMLSEMEPPITPYNPKQDEALEPVSSPPEWTRRQWDRVQQLEAKVLYLQKQLHERIDPTRGGKQTPKGIIPL